MNPATARLSTFLDRLVRPEIRLAGRSWPAFRLCGYVGLAASLLLTSGLTLYRGLSLLVLAGLVLAAILTFLGLAMATKILTGEERLVYYHQEIAILTVNGLLLWLFQKPVWSYLDIMILGVGTFLACGRVGCLMVGCCHGRPNAWGVCYRPAHAAEGFPAHYVGVRLFPVQALESLWVVAIVGVGVALLLGGAAPGAALAWYVVSYDLGRFGFEFLRGDAARPYRGGFSQPQWISLLLMCGVVGAELAGLLAWQAWHAVATAGLAAVMIGIVLHRRSPAGLRYRIRHPQHVEQLARALDQVTRAAEAPQRATGAAPPIASTSLGLRLSAGKIGGADGPVDFYAFSAGSGPLPAPAARAVADLILQLRHPAGSAELIQGGHGVYHLCITPAGPRNRHSPPVNSII